MSTVLVAGTHAWRGGQTLEWFFPASLFAQFLGTHDIDVVSALRGDDKLPFIWSTDLGGVGLNKDDCLVWQAAGVNLFWFCVPPRCPANQIPPADLNIIAHSHGLQVVLHAAGTYGLKINRLVSVSSPVREDMRKTAELARKNIAFWTHLHSDFSDRWQWLGEMFDGHFGVVREHPLADVNVKIPKVGHSQLLRDPEKFDLWIRNGWLSGFD